MSSPGNDSDGGTPRLNGRKSARGRQLKRWNPSEDQLLLLYIDSVCCVQGVALPWDEIGYAMEPREGEGQPLSGEAIKQHLAKVRSARVEEGLRVPEKPNRNQRRVPPPKSTLATPASGKGRGGVKIKTEPLATPSKPSRSTLLAPPTRAEEAAAAKLREKAARAAATNDKAAEKAAARYATPRTPAKRGRQSRADVVSDDESDYQSDAPAKGQVKRLRKTPRKNYAEPAPADSDDDHDILADNGKAYTEKSEDELPIRERFGIAPPSKQSGRTSAATTGAPAFKVPIAPMAPPPQPIPNFTYPGGRPILPFDHNTNYALPNYNIGDADQYTASPSSYDLPTYGNNHQTLNNIYAPYHTPTLGHSSSDDAIFTPNTSINSSFTSAGQQASFDFNNAIFGMGQPQGAGAGGMGSFFRQFDATLPRFGEENDGFGDIIDYEQEGEKGQDQQMGEGGDGETQIKYEI
ncbi:hypothetical protein B0A48_09532 [Cryoendolithus antarcticus]|uniref:Myb-like domain-containing protein n=1 Tax=Cryoendolithus antarcticus TaxID=1507870 RepID=A0A1V8SZV2_9PEZI|nr:hypothetical protein B0A48_09532 [Cryoendolithus antarcticus]